MPSGSPKPPGRARKRRGDSTRSVYETLRGMILSLDLQPGQKIDEESLAALCRVSRTPVREALFRLASEGLVVLLPNRVTQVALLDTATLHDYLEGMDLIQRAVNRWAAIRASRGQIATVRELAAGFEAAAAGGDLRQMVLANRDFHLAIGDAAGNALLAQAYQRLLDVGLRVARFTLRPDRPRAPSLATEPFVSAINAEHWAMVAAIERGDADESERLALSHTERTRARFATYLETSLAADLRINAPDPLLPVKHIA